MKNSIPKVSVILPFFNAEDTLERAVYSILNQTFSDFELILVNNNSTDKSRDIAWMLSGEDERIILIEEKQQGVSYAANTGNKAARGNYIARMDADDVSLPLRLEKQVELLDNNPETGVASCLVKHIGHHENTGGIENFVNWANSLQNHNEIFMNRFIEMPLINPTTMFRSDLLHKNGGFIHGDFPEDYELWLRWMNNEVKIEKVPEVLLHWYDSETRLTRTDPRYSTDAFYRTKAQYLSKWLAGNDHPYVWVWGAGRVTRKRVDMLQELGIWVEGYIDVKERYFDDICCISYEDFNWEAPSFILSFVGNHGARDQIRKFLVSKGKIEGKDFLLVA
jgi:glycosyltransferase involved in cell wall biosynthesis